MPSKTPPFPSGNECSPGWESFDSFCYLAMSGNGTLTWHQSQQYCRQMEGDLVKITNERENVFVLALARKKAPAMKQMYIGLMRTANRFYWSDYSVPVYRNWAPREPNGNAREPCSNMWTGHTTYLPYRANGYWNDRPCHGIPYFTSGFVCKALP
ncbi:perlucin-like protein [Oculina patagonica]